MKTKSPYIYLYVAIATLLLSACSATRTATKTPMIGNLSGQAYAEKVIEQAPRWNTLNGKVTLNLKTQGKKDIKVNGTLRMKRNESIQILVTPLLGIEMARLEITPQGILAIDRMGKRYAQADFASLGLEIGFETIQALFLNEVFLPGKTNLQAADATSFTVTQDGDTQACLEPTRQKIFYYRFLASAQQGQLQETHVGMKGMPYKLTWHYDDFQPLATGTFPQHMEVTATNGTRSATLDMKLSRLSTTGNWDTRTDVSAKYKRIEIADLIKIINAKL